MFVFDWMTLKVYMVGPNDCIADALRIMKEMDIKHVPVVREGTILGIVTDRDIKEFNPAKAATFDMYELHYIFEKTKVKEVMKSPVITTTPDTPIEEAAELMYDRNIGCLVVEKEGKLAGIITESDIFRALIDITGVRRGGHRFCLTIDDKPQGAIKKIADIIRQHGFGIHSILTTYEKVEKGNRTVVFRTSGTGSFGALKAELRGSYKNVIVTKGTESPQRKS